MLQIDCGGSAVVFAHADDRSRLSRRGKVVSQGIGMEEVCGFWLARGVRRKPGLGRRVDQEFGERMRLGEPEPVVVAKREGHVGALEMFDRRQNIQHCELDHALWVIEGKSMGKVSSEAMAASVEAVVTKAQPYRHN